MAFDRGGEGVLRLDPDALTVVPGPGPGCGEVTDVEVEGRIVRLRCDHDSGRLFVGDLEAGRFEPLQSEPLQVEDPFAERDLVENEDWQWRLRGRAGGRPGTLEARLHGREVELVEGRFSFDEIDSLALYHEDRLDLATAGGWYQAPSSGDLHVRGWRRPSAASPPPETVTRIRVTRRGDERLLCLETAAGAAVLRSRRGVEGTVRACDEDLGRGALWSYRRREGRLRIDAPGRTGGRAQRSMAEGRSSDHVVTGQPVTGGDEAGSFSLVPTRAGILRFDAAAHVYAPPFEGLDPRAVPSILYVGEGGTVYLADGVYVLLTGEKIAAPAELGTPEGARISGLEAGPLDFLRLRWTLGDAAGWSFLDPRTYAAVESRQEIFDATGWEAFVRRRARRDDPSPWFRVELRDRGLLFRPADGESAYELPWRRELRPVGVARIGRRLLLVEAGEVSEVRLDRVTAELLEN